MAFRTPVDIAKRACQHVGKFPIAAFDDDSEQANQINTCYDNLRLAELSRHTWGYSIRRARVRPLTFSSQIWAPPTYSAVTAYTVGQVVNAASSTYANGVVYPWILQVPTATGATPDTSTQWSHFFGSLVTDIFDSGANYAAGELAIVPPTYAGGTTYPINAIVSDGTGTFYVSLAGSNTGHTPSTSPTWWTPWIVPSSNNQATLPYSAIVFQSAPSVYISTFNNNGPIAPATAAVLPSASTKWTLVGGTVQQLTILWPTGSGPFTDVNTFNLFPLPFGWLRPAPHYAKRASHPWLGALYGDDGGDVNYTYYGQYFSSDTGMGLSSQPYLDLTFVADIADVSVMAPQFCESLAIRIGLEIDEPLTQGKNTAKLEADYKRITGEAMRVDAIIQGTPTQPIEEFIRVRI